jgi:ATP diphosphatase
VGFDWPETAPIFDKIAEEIAELKTEIDSGSKPERIEDELGDLFFAAVNLARKLKADPEQSLRQACRKFERRFRAIEDNLAASGRNPETASLAEMETEWQKIKALE